jgi:peroxiredoxin
MGSSLSYRQNCVAMLFGLLTAGQLTAWDGFAAEPPEATTLTSLLTSQTRQTFVAIRDYAAAHPDAPDRPAALLWLFRTAADWGWEADVISLSEKTLQSGTADPALAAEARICLALGLAQAGDALNAQTVLDDHLRSLRLRNPQSAIDLTQSLALRLQLRNDLAGAAAMYERLTAAFFLNSDVRDAADARRARLALVGKPAPELNVPDLEGQPLEWNAVRGKVVLLDFWATNCRPCLEELPRLTAVQRELHPLGLEVIGISLDDQADTVKSFRETQRLAWRLALDNQQVTPRYQVSLIPCVLLVDRAGTVAATDVRPVDWRWAALRLLSSKSDK